ncbi:MAG: hypothetical protein M3O70_03710 [Actinomycetota bacterium]|nr:hypothetical protein [Actinomycetota bacterium]
MTRTEWEARATAVLEPAPDLNVSLRSYAYDLVTRDVVQSTYAAVLANPRFQREAAESLGLPDSVRDKVRVKVGRGTRAATMTVTVTSPDPRVAEQVAHATLESARSYIDPLNRLFVLRVAPPEAGGPPSQRQLRVSVPAAGALVVAAAGLAVIAYAGSQLGLKWSRRASARAPSG